jgi:predicted 2-oxoglutarate/Fe(II)-dependent dioxygenase YbiX
LKQYVRDTIVRYPEIFLCDYNKMILLLFLIIIVFYLIPVYNEPRVMKNLLTYEECEYIKKKAEKKLQTSTIGGNHHIDERIRKSETAWLSKEDPIIRNIIDRCLEYTDRPPQNCEKLQVLRYTTGGHYAPHQDVLKRHKNPRMYTFILALNDDYEGGETEFPNIKKKFKLNKGDVLFFDTLDNYELVTSKALHGGRPVKYGEKWVCNLWVHKYPYSS